MPKYLVLDTETAGGLAYPLTYDIGGVVVDETGYIWERFHWAILDIIGNPSIMATAFYANKMPVYWQEVYNGNIQPLYFRDALRKITALIDFHDIEAIPAYNMAFDNRALSNTCRHIYDSPRWLNRETPLWCIWSAACQSVLNTDKYIRWAVKNGYISEKGNPLTNAETCFQYITGNANFREEHTGGRDAEIEATILTAILRRKTRPDFSIKGSPWRIPSKRYHEMLKGGKLGKTYTSLVHLKEELKQPPYFTDNRANNRLIEGED